MSSAPGSATGPAAPPYRPSLGGIAVQRLGLELRTFLRQRDSVVFTLLFPVVLLVIFGSVFDGEVAPGV